MAFAAQLREILEIRGSQVPSEFSRGDSLRHVLDRHLTSVERMGDGDLIASILLLSPCGKRLSYGAGPNLPDSLRCEVEIGPHAGSCGTAVYLGRPVYVTDIATDPRWTGIRHLALPHGLRSSWSTPIRASDGSVLGTFALLHRKIGAPTRGEIEAIEMISGHVAHAIAWFRTSQDLDPLSPRLARERPRLKLVSDNERTADTDRLLRQLDRLEVLAGVLDRQAARMDSESATAEFGAAARDCRRLISVIRHRIERRG